MLPSSAAMEALTNLATQLGVSTTSAGKPDNNSTTRESNNLLAWEEDDDCDFSSFPSLSLEESPGNYHTGTFHNRGDVESHVESLLSRPILLGKQPQQQSQDVTATKDDDDADATVEDDSLDEFFVDTLQEVPQLMLTNFCTSFSTLMNSRLRAYATFLTRHALSLATENEVEGMIGIEHKLATMLGIGRQVKTEALASNFIVLENDTNQVQQQPEDNDDDDNTTFQVTLPVKMDIRINISLPHVDKSDGNEFMKLTFQATGKICGIFTKLASADEHSLLRVAEVNLNMHELLTDMATQAAHVISRIVDMTNAAYTVPLPCASSLPGGGKDNDGLECDYDALVRASMPPPPSPPSSLSPRKRRSVSQEGQNEKNDGEDDDVDAMIVSLSAENCATLVDCLIGELDETVLSPPTPAKKLKIFHGVGAPEWLTN